MKQHFKFLLVWTTLISFLGCGQKNDKVNNDNAKTILTEQYVSIDCPTGDITLTLNSDQTFDLVILFWDNESQKHTGNESVKGKWYKSDKDLVLITKNNTIIYEVTTTNMKIGNLELNAFSYGFKSNDKDFFATDYKLVEQAKTDEFLLKAIKNHKENSNN